MNNTGYSSSIWSSDFSPNDYPIPMSPNIPKFNNMSNNFSAHPSVLIIHKSDDNKKKIFKENDEILPEITLPGQLISIIRGNGGKADINYILEKIEPLFLHLRRINGRKYSGKLMKTVIGGLHSTEIFQFDNFNNVWELKEDLAKKYENKTVEKFKLWRKKISKKERNIDLAFKKKKNYENKRTYQRKPKEFSLKNLEIPSNDSFNNFKEFASEGPHNENSYHQAEFGNYMLQEMPEVPSHSKKEEQIFENNNDNPNHIKPSITSFSIMNNFNNEEIISNTLKSDQKMQYVKKKKRIYKRSYEKYNIAFRSLEKVVEYMLDKNYSNLIKNPFNNLNGNESPEEIIQKIGTENIIGVVRCFDYFKPLLIENIEKKNKLKNLVVKGDGPKTSFLVNVAKDVSDIKNKLNNIFNNKNE